MDIEFAAQEYFSTVRKELEGSGRSHKTLRVKSIMNRFGYSRRSQAFVESVNTMLDTCGLYAAPYFSIDLPLDSRIYITLKTILTSKRTSLKKLPTQQAKNRRSFQ